MEKSLKVAFTGGPCTGKTTVYDDLYINGFTKVPEVARYWLALFKRHELHGVEYNREFFQKLIEVNHISNWTIADDLSKLEHKPLQPHSALFDRTLPDEIAYRKFFGLPVEDSLIADCKRFKVDMVFVFPYWEEIYKTDEVRVETPEQAQQLETLIIDAYKLVGYDPIIVPKTSVDERIDFIFRTIKNQI